MKIVHCSDIHLGRRPVGGKGEFSDKRYEDYFKGRRATSSTSPRSSWIVTARPPFTMAVPVKSLITALPLVICTTSSCITWSMIRSMPVPPAPTLWSPSSLWAARRSSAVSASARWKSGLWKLTVPLTPCRRS